MVDVGGERVAHVVGRQEQLLRFVPSSLAKTKRVPRGSEIRSALHRDHRSPVSGAAVHLATGGRKGKRSSSRAAHASPLFPARDTLTLDLRSLSMAPGLARPLKNLMTESQSARFETGPNEMRFRV